MRSAGSVRLPVGEALLDVLNRRFVESPDREAFLFGNRPVSFGELWEEAGRFAAALIGRGLAPGERVVTALPNGPEFFFVFYGIQRAGGVPVPLFHDSGPLRLARIATHTAARFLAVPRAISEPARLGLERHLAGAGVQIISFADGPGAVQCRFPEPDPAGTAYIQYTSGSTGDPKGVLISHRNVSANIQHLVGGMAITADDVFVSWLPLYHDMGLVLMSMVPFCMGARLVLLPAGLVNVQAWLRAIEEHAGTFTAAPDFAYRFCLRYLKNPARFDLRSLRIALDAAEPVRAATIEEFERTFGLKNVLRPGYGLAEATVGVSMCPPGTDVRKDSRGRVSVGPPFPGVEVRVLNAGAPAFPGLPGEIQVRSAATTSGYHDNPRATRALKAGNGYIRTGDLGFLDEDGNLYIVGRRKDIIVHGGRTIAPGEVEEIVDEVPRVRFSAAVGVDRGRVEGEQVYVFAEVRGGADGDALGALAREIVRRFHGHFGFRPGRVYLLSPHAIPRTPNGKIRRGRLRNYYSSGELRRSSLILFPEY